MSREFLSDHFYMLDTPNIEVPVRAIKTNNPNFEEENKNHL